MTIKKTVEFGVDANGVDFIICNGVKIFIYDSGGYVSAEIDGLKFESILEAIKYCEGQSS